MTPLMRVLPEVEDEELYTITSPNHHLRSFQCLAHITAVFPQYCVPSQQMHSDLCSTLSQKAMNLLIQADLFSKSEPCWCQTVGAKWQRDDNMNEGECFC